MSLDHGRLDPCTNIIEIGSLFCSWLLEAIDCIGCKPWQSVFPTRAMNLERYYYRYGLADYLTPMRLYDLCRADREGNYNCKCISIIHTIHRTLAKHTDVCMHVDDVYVHVCMYILYLSKSKPFLCLKKLRKN